MKRQAHGAPVIVGENGLAPIERLQLGLGVHNEGWLQSLIFDHPETLPIADIEPGFGMPVAVAREIGCGHGSIDNLYVTPSGEIILVEVKLWRNPEARREVIAQALDYVSALMAMTYSQFETALIKSRGPVREAGSLYALLSSCDEVLEEPQFIDAVTRNLTRGRMLVIALGDGIRQETQALAGLLQSHAGAHFTFALVELATWRHGITGEIIAIPNTLAQTLMIERGIVAIEAGGAVVRPVAVTSAATVKAGPRSISEELFYEEIAKRDPALPGYLQAFIASLEPLGVYTEMRATLNLKIDLDEVRRPINLGYVRRDGRFRSAPVLYSLPHGPGLHYSEALIRALGGSLVVKGDGTYVSIDGVSEPYLDQILPMHADAWREAIVKLIDEVRRAPVQ